MKKILLGIFLMASLCGKSQQIEVAKITGGIVKGVTKNEITIFKGIPYAAPPIGELRWKAPQRAKAWNDTLKAIKFGPAPMQDKAVADIYFQNPEMSEDCLYLNVWTGAKNENEKRPVMVWIHGGGFAGGSTSIPAYDGTTYAKKGVVYVSFGYRVGPMGFLAHPELSKESGQGSGCYGIMDQIHGLKWVQENIAKFGGDPKNVTVFGESAGGFSTSILTLAPAAKGLFQRAICQSGTFSTPLKYGNEAGMTNVSLQLAEKTGQQLLNNLGAKTIKEARALSATAIMASIPRFDEFPFWPVTDGATIPADPFIIYQKGNVNDVDLLAGFNSDEGAFFIKPDQKLTATGFEKMIRENYGPAAEALLKVYPHATDDEAVISQKNIVRESMFGNPTWSSLNLHSKKKSKQISHKTYGYFFDFYDKKSSPGGATHGGEVPYTLLLPLPGKENKAMIDLMGSYWLNFAKTGNPNGEGLPIWPEWDTKNQQVMYFGQESASKKLPTVEQNKAWDIYYEWRRK